MSIPSRTADGGHPYLVPAPSENSWTAHARMAFDAVWRSLTAIMDPEDVSAKERTEALQRYDRRRIKFVNAVVLGHPVGNVLHKASMMLCGSTRPIERMHRSPIVPPPRKMKRTGPGAFKMESVRLKPGSEALAAMRAQTVEPGPGSRWDDFAAIGTVIDVASRLIGPDATSSAVGLQAWLRKSAAEISDAVSQVLSWMTDPSAEAADGPPPRTVQIAERALGWAHGAADAPVIVPGTSGTKAGPMVAWEGAVLWNGGGVDRFLEVAVRAARFVTEVAEVGRESLATTAGPLTPAAGPQWHLAEISGALRFACETLEPRRPKASTSRLNRTRDDVTMSDWLRRVDGLG